MDARGLSNRRLSPRRVACALLTVLSTAALAISCGGGSAGQPGPSGSAAPRPGGSITLGGFTFTQLDPGQPGYINGSNPYNLLIYGSLFLPPAKAGGAYVPDLATSYSFNGDGTSLTLNLRQGVTFQDGTPFNADAVLWNFKRWTSPQSTNNQYFNTVTSMTANGSNQVTLNFNQPNFPIIAALSSSSAGFMGSPTAFQQLGAAKYGASPVGAGPYRVSSSVPGQVTVLNRYPQYWDAGHVYLNQITYKNTGADANVQYTDLASGAIHEAQFSGIDTPPTVISQAKDNKQLASMVLPSVQYALMPVNTYKPPFDNAMARQAIAYCTDRKTIAENVQQGFATPAYILSGQDGDFVPEGGVGGAQKLMPYRYDVSKGKELVRRLGQLSFDMQVYTAHNQTIATALAQQWADCGIKAKVQNVQPPAFLVNVANGSYQMGLTSQGGSSSPQLWTQYQTPTTPLGRYGFNDQQVQSLIHQSFATTDRAKLASTWRTIWQRVNTLAVDFPLLSSGTYLFHNKCVSGIGSYTFGADLTHAYLACSV